MSIHHRSPETIRRITGAAAASPSQSRFEFEIIHNNAIAVSLVRRFGGPYQTGTAQ